MARLLQSDARITPAQLRRLQTLWHLWTRKLKLRPEAERRLRHYYVHVLSRGRAAETKGLTRADAARVLAQLERLAVGAAPEELRAAGTAGRHGFPQRRGVRPTAASWRALWAAARALGINRRRLEEFIRTHYAGVRLRSLADLRTMADLNRVLWGLKAILRRGPRGSAAARRAA
jgi:hypothetical protein